MRNRIKLNDMETANLLTIMGAFFSGSLIGVAALIKQAKANTEFHERLKAVEEESKKLDEIKEDITTIRVENAKYHAIQEQNQEHLKLVADTVNHIHTRIDQIPNMPPNGG